MLLEIMLLCCIIVIIVPLLVYLGLCAFLLLVALYVKLKLEPVRRACTSKVRLDGKIALVTGGNQSIGLETARDLAARGAKVIIACRNAERTAEAIADIAATTGNIQVEYKHLDLSKFSSIKKFVEDFNNSYDRLDILVNNAGCCGGDVMPTDDGIDIVMQVNYYGPFLLTNLLLDKLIASKPSRIVIVSSWFHSFGKLDIGTMHQRRGKGSLGDFLTYSNSKLCDLLWTKALAKRLPKGVTVNALHPGVIKTDVLIHAVPFLKHRLFYNVADKLVFRTPEEGAQTTIHLCVAEEVKGVRGKYFMECEEAEYSRKADDDELVEQVWNRSVQLTS